MWPSSRGWRCWDSAAPASSRACKSTGPTCPRPPTASARAATVVRRLPSTCILANPKIRVKRCSWEWRSFPVESEVRISPGRMRTARPWVWGTWCRRGRRPNKIVGARGCCRVRVDRILWRTIWNKNCFFKFNFWCWMDYATIVGNNL